MKQLLIILLILSFNCTSFAEDMEIKVNKQSIKLPYWPAQEPHYGGVIFVRGGEPAQWSELLNNLSLLLARNGWSTVLLNANPENSVSWLTLLPEVISTLRQNKNKRIVLVHHGEQLNATLDYFTKPQGKTVNGVVLLSAYDNKVSTVKPDSLRFPILDIAGQFDYENVTNQQEKRAAVFKSPTYMTIQIPGADHDYNYATELLISFVTGWMLKIPESTVSSPPIKAKSLVQQSYIEPLATSRLVAINGLQDIIASLYSDKLNHRLS
jgi:hypothetical protein